MIPAADAIGSLRHNGWLAALLKSFILLAVVAGACLLIAVCVSKRVERYRCRHQLRSLGVAVAMYQNQHPNAMPANWLDLATSEQFTASIFICPSSGDRVDPSKTFPELLLDLEAPGGKHCSYIYKGDRAGILEPMTGTHVIAFERPRNHGDGIHVLRADDTVIWLSTIADTAKIAALLADNNRGVRPLVLLDR